MTMPVVSLFCGCGGLDLGFVQENFDPVLALDISPAAIKTYNHNHGKDIARVADLAETDGSDIIAMLEDKGTKPPQGIIGGSPCQTFSKGNVHARADDIRHVLPERFATILKVLNAKYNLDFFVFENVRGITFNKHRKNFARFKGLFEAAGFELFESLLDAQCFGVPQKRPRVFVVGFNRDRYNGLPFGFPVSNGGVVRTVASAIQDLPEPMFFARGMKPEHIPYHPNHWTMRPRSPKFENGYLKEGQSKGRSFRVLSWTSPSWTVAYGNREIHVHPSGNRRLSVYEAMLLQGFPERYELLGNLSEQVQQVSDAVPPPLAMALARSIRLFLAGDELEHKTHVQLSLLHG